MPWYRDRIKAEAVAERLEYFNLPIPTADRAWQCLALDFVRRKSGEDFRHRLLSERKSPGKRPAGPAPLRIFQDDDDRLIVLGWGSQAAPCTGKGSRQPRPCAGAC
jgi:hypothetical protein